MPDDASRNDAPAAEDGAKGPRKGGLGRGLGALIPSAPLGRASGKGHFWTALDNPPPVDTAAPPSAIAEGPRLSTDVSRETGGGEPSTVAPEDGPSTEGAVPDAADDSGGSGDSSAGADSSTGGDPSLNPVAAPDTGIGARLDSSEASRSLPPTDAPAVLVEVDPDLVDANPKNPRQVFDDDELSELAASVAEFGLLQPIVVRQSPGDPDRFELVMGERRLRAARLAGLATIPAIMRQTDDDAMLRDALLENIHRVQLHPLEEAAAYQQLIDEFGVTHEELASRIKRSRPVISNTIRLLKLPVRVQNRVAAGIISGSHARALLSLDSADAQEALATRIIAEGLSVRATEEAVALSASEAPPSQRHKRSKVTAPALAGLAERLSDHFDTRALVQLGRTKGKIVVEFASIDDLERLIAMMAPPLATARLTEDLASDDRPAY